jgi:hypothetical protein
MEVVSVMSSIDTEVGFYGAMEDRTYGPRSQGPPDG